MELGVLSKRTTRYFSDEPVTDEQLKTPSITFAPQGGNRQPVRFIVVKDQEKRNSLPMVPSPVEGLPR